MLPLLLDLKIMLGHSFPVVYVLSSSAGAAGHGEKCVCIYSYESGVTVKLVIFNCFANGKLEYRQHVTPLLLCTEWMWLLTRLCFCVWIRYTVALFA